MRHYIGTVCVCSTGRVGLVVRRREVTFPDGQPKLIWEGIGLDGKGLWASTADEPLVLHPSIDAYLDRLVKALSQPGCVYPPLGSGSLNPLKA